MPHALSLHIGLNQVDPSHYGSAGTLRGCENDATAMKQLADQIGFRSARLMTREATVSKVIHQISSAAERLNEGDIFLLTYSGHGGQVDDKNGDEDDYLDETWCLYDRQLVDDELNAVLATFKRGVRILVLSDSCHSGTVTKMLLFETAWKGVQPKDEEATWVRTLPWGLLRQTYLKHQDLYDRVQVENPLGDRVLLSASVLLISGCQDWQLSADLPTNGLFTQQLLEVWNGGTFQGNYIEFHQAIFDRMPDNQKPNYFKQGVPNSNFEMEMPFAI
jgi:hypothetical protein